MCRVFYYCTLAVRLLVLKKILPLAIFLCCVSCWGSKAFGQSGLRIDKTQRPVIKKINLGPDVNSPFSELNPIISVDGQKLFFTMGVGNPQNLGPEHLQDCYVSLKRNGHWTQPIPLEPPINTAANDAISGVLADGRTLFIKNYAHNHLNGLCFARPSKSGWTIDSISIDGYQNSNPLATQSISSDGSLILFSAETEEGYGGLDLYVTKLVDRATNHYGKPENLGPVINTAKDDFSPFLAPDGQTLYFSSRGRPGYGDADMYLATRLDDSWINWTAPKNLGPELNTGGMDAYYSIPASGDVAYCSSSNGQNHLDIYMITLSEDLRPHPVVLVTGTVKSPSGTPLEAYITCRKLSNDSLVASMYSSILDGRFALVLPVGIQYSIHAENKQYLPYSDNLDLTNAVLYREVRADIVLDSIIKGGSITLRNIFFDLDKASLRPESHFELDNLADLMKRHNDWDVVIEGHTDSLGTAEHNLTLSQERAATVVQYLIAKGISPKQLTSVGLGATKPVDDNSTEEGRQANRRVVFRIRQLEGQ